MRNLVYKNNLKNNKKLKFVHWFFFNKKGMLMSHLSVE